MKDCSRTWSCHTTREPDSGFDKQPVQQPELFSTCSVESGWGKQFTEGDEHRGRLGIVFKLTEGQTP